MLLPTNRRHIEKCTLKSKHLIIRGNHRVPPGVIRIPRRFYVLLIPGYCEVPWVEEAPSWIIGQLIWITERAHWIIGQFYNRLKRNYALVDVQSQIWFKSCFNCQVTHEWVSGLVLSPSRYIKRLWIIDCEPTVDMNCMNHPVLAPMVQLMFSVEVHSQLAPGRWG